MSEEFLEEIKDMLKYASRNKDWLEVCQVIERINEELGVTDKVDYVSPRDRDEDLSEEDEL